MALDYLPTKQIQQGGGQQAYSPETIKMLREYSKALMGQKQKPTQLGFYSPWQGAADMSSQIMGGLAMREADLKDRAYHDVVGNEAAIHQPGYGNTTATASGGAGAGAPFTSTTGEPQEEAQTRGRQPSGVQTASLDPSSGASDAAMWLSSKGETGKDPSMAALFNISSDTKNSKSYGPFGLNSKTGSASEFAQEHPEFGLKAKPGTPEFDQQWRRASAVMPDKMKDAHKDWHQKHIMDGLPDEMTKAGVDPKIANDPRVQTYMADRKLQMGKAGLDTALMYGKLSNSPEEFIRRISQVDKQRIPYNFPSYLEDHPNNSQGLANRIDLRHNTALAMADPDTTGKMVDFYKNGQGNTPPTQLAQNTSRFQNPPLPTGRLQEETGQLLRGLISRGQMDPSEAVGVAERLNTLRKGNMPQYQVDPHGRVIRQAPGEIQQVLPGVMPGYFGNFKEEKDMGGAGIREFIDPNTGRLRRRYEVPEPPVLTGEGTGVGVPPPRQGTSTPVPVTKPPVSPTTGAVVQTPTQPAPTSPAPTPTNASQPPASAIAGGPLTTSPPAVKPTATDAPSSTSLWGSIPEPKSHPMVRLASLANNVAAADPAETTPEALKKLPTSNPPTEVVKKYFDDAEKLPRTQPGDAVPAPDILGDLKSGDIGRLSTMGERKKAYGELVTEEGKKQSDAMAKWLVGIHDTGAQSRKQMPSLKQNIHIMDHPELGMAQGPFAPAEALFKAARQNLGRVGKELGIPGAEIWANMQGGEANQIFTKNISALTLENLRSMLGQNAGQFRQYEMVLMRQALGGEELSPGAQKTVMRIIDRINDRNVLYDEMATEWARKHGGTLDERFREAAIRFDEDHPTFTPDEFDHYMKELGGGTPPVKGALGTPPPTGGDTPGGLPTLEDIQRARERRKAK